MNHSYSCVCELTDLGEYDEYLIELCDESGCDVVEQEFKPSENSKYDLVLVHNNYVSD